MGQLLPNCLPPNNNYFIGGVQKLAVGILICLPEVDSNLSEQVLRKEKAKTVFRVPARILNAEWPFARCTPPPSEKPAVESHRLSLLGYETVVCSEGHAEVRRKLG